jgi:hypothetical protein
MWRKIWEAIAPHPCDHESSENCYPERRLAALDLEETGEVSIDDIHSALRDVVRLSVDEEERSLAQFVHSFADADGDGRVTIADFNALCDEIMPAIYANQAWRLAFPRSEQAAVAT